MSPTLNIITLVIYDCKGALQFVAYAMIVISAPKAKLTLAIARNINYNSFNVLLGHYSIKL